jgi:glycosyltransferase
MKISLITACYNNEQTIADTLQSVLSQTYSNLEYLIVDGASTDGTLAIIKEQLATSGRPQAIRLISEPDAGIYDALNKGLALATGDVIGFLHADDVFYDVQVLEHVAAAFAANNCDAVYGNLQYVSKENEARVIRNWISEPFTPARLKQGWMPPHPTLYLKNEIYTNHGTFDLSFHIAADYDFMLRIFSKGITSHFINSYMVKMRVGGKSNALGNLTNKMKEDLKALRKNKVGGFYSLFLKNISKIPQFFK